MTTEQFENLTEDEIGICLHIVNVIAPPKSPSIEFEPRQLTWFKHDMLVKKLLGAFPSIKPEGHAIYSSLLKKLGVEHQIKYEQPPSQGSTEGSSEKMPPSTEVTASGAEAQQTGSAEITGSAI